MQIIKFTIFCILVNSHENTVEKGCYVFLQESHLQNPEVWIMNLHESEDAASVYYSSTALLYLVQRAKMTMANEKWTSEVKRCKSNEKLMTKWEAKSKWNINVNISIQRPPLKRNISLINYGRWWRPSTVAWECDNNVEEMTDKVSNVGLDIAGARGAEISLSNCRRFPALALPVFVCVSKPVLSNSGVQE